MKKWKSSLKWLLPVVALLLVLAGCQSVSGLDVDKVLSGNADVKSLESSMSFSVHVEPTQALTEEDQEVIDLINSFSLKMDEVKVEDATTMSANGELSSGKLKVPFEMSLNKDVMAIKVEGAKKAYYMPMTEEINAAGLAGLYGGDGLNGLDPATTQALSKELQSFFIKHLPNPAVINVSKVDEAIHGEQLGLTKLHAEITGDELTGLLKTFLQSISEDKEGLKAFLGGLYDGLLPVLKEQGITNLQELEMGLGDVSLDNKESVIKETYTKLQAALDLLLLSYDDAVKDALAEEPEISTVLGKGTKLTTDIYVDGSYNVRKQSLDFKMALPDLGEELPISSFSIKMDSEQWNVNGPVKAVQLDTQNAIDLTNETLTPGSVLRNLDPQSGLYGVLKNDLGITKKYIALDPEYDDVVVKGTTSMIPLRYLAEYLDASVTTDKGKIYVTDDLSGKQLIFTPGSAYAVINGSTVKMAQPVFADKYGRTYAPLRVLAEGLQAHVQRDSDGTLYITRE